MMDYDYVIVGSGFGGSVSALRLVEKGYRVLLVEKGKWYHHNEFARNNWQLSKWLWVPKLGMRGIMRLSFLKHLNIISGVGVGGGSLVYANTLPVPKKDFYSKGSWAGLENWEEELKPHYSTALKMLGAVKNPKLYEADLALKTLAEQIGKVDCFESTDVAVFFGKSDISVPDPYFNGEGPERTGCNFCGGCMTGCNNNSKNTLDKNYLYLAQKRGLAIMAEKEVTDVVPLDDAEGKNGYRITMRSTCRLFHKREEVTAKGVIFSGGVMGTVKLLLKLKKSSLHGLSEMVGEHIRSNNETLISVTNLDGTRDLSKGIAIGSMLQTDENSHLEVVRYIEGSGFWRLSHFPMSVGKNIWKRIGRYLFHYIERPGRMLRLFFISNWGKRTAVLLYMQTLDSTLRFRLSAFGSLVSRIGTGNKPTPFIPESIDLTQRYSNIVNGEPTVIATETFGGTASTAHILGGAVMGSNISEGVIDKNNRVFGYENMLVI
ncbi:MAG: GMC family oxidoreductase, partial [Prolixibacteraceae bacterium]|nr:GMC family oxidoreductase [Prolixibacteraceae bacterium]